MKLRSGRSLPEMAAVNKPYKRYQKKPVPVVAVNPPVYRGIKPPKDTSRPEKKYLSVNNNTQSVNNGGTVVLINGIGQGTAATGRIGNKVHLKSVQYRMIISQPAASNQRSIVRVMLIYDNQPSGALPAVTNVGSASTGILDTGTTTGTAYVNTNEPMWIPNGRRYVILSDKTFTLNSQLTNVGMLFHLKKYKKLKTYTEFNSANSSISDVTTGALYLVYMSDVISGSNEPVITYTTRVRYTDA